MYPKQMPFLNKLYRDTVDGQKAERKFRLPKLTRIEKLMRGLQAERNVSAIFAVKEVEGKGRGVFLRAPKLRKDSFVLEYEGDVIPRAEAEHREKIYARNSEGCYILFFTFQGAKLAIDATRRYDSYARLLNHSRCPNIRFHAPFTIDLNDGLPRIATYALRDIHKGEELVVDYGIRDGEISWLRNREVGFAADVDSDSSDGSDYSSISNSLTDPQPEEFSVVRLDKLQSEGSRTRVALHGGEWGMRLTNLFPGRQFKRYVSDFESIGDPLKIVKLPEDESSGRRQHSDAESIISLSSSLSNGSSCRVDASSTSHRNTLTMDQSSDILEKTSGSELPCNKAPDSIHKVLEWQAPSSPEGDTSHIQIVHVQSLSDSPHFESDAGDDHGSSYRQHTSSYFQSQEASENSQHNHLSRANRIPDNFEQIDADSSHLLPSLSSAHTPTSESVVVLDISESEDEIDSFTPSHFSDDELGMPGTSSGSRSQVMSEKVDLSCNSPDVCVISDDECLPDVDLLDKQHKGVVKEDLSKHKSTEGKSFSSDVGEVDFIVVPDSPPPSKKLAMNLPARRPVGFSSPPQTQVAVIKPFVDSSASTRPESDIAAEFLTESELERMKSFYINDLSTSTLPLRSIKQVIDGNWDFFSILIRRGVSVDQIRSVFYKFRKT